MQAQMQHAMMHGAVSEAITMASITPMVIEAVLCTLSKLSCALSLHRLLSAWTAPVTARRRKAEGSDSPMILGLVAALEGAAGGGRGGRGGGWLWSNEK